MTRHAYTVHDTPAVVARIEGDLAIVQATVRRSDPHLRALVLTGGFSRGEGAVRGGTPQNDYDLVAVRGVGRPRFPYARVREELEARLGLHVDLAPVAAWRLPWVAPTVFWYETALRGRVLWGEDLLRRIRIRTVESLDRAEGLRLLVNRAAGLLLATPADDEAVRLQAAKALLAAADAHLLAAGTFAPTQTERWNQVEAMRTAGTLPIEVQAFLPWLAWAYRFKVDPDAAASPDRPEAWSAARQAVLAAVPAALHHARLATLDAYTRRDGLLDHWVYARRAHAIPGARLLALHPTGRVRVATLALLESARDGRVSADAARRALGGLGRVGNDPLGLLGALRQATLQ